MQIKYEITLLNRKKHKRDLFDCDNNALNDYLQQRASQEQDRHVCAVYVLTEIGLSVVLGYYTLSATSVVVSDLPENILKKLPKYNSIPATLIGRLAVDKKIHRQGIGTLLLLDALRRAVENSLIVGSFAVIVDTKDDRAKNFYKKYGFWEFLDNEYKLFVPMKTIKDIL